MPHKRLTLIQKLGEERDAFSPDDWRRLAIELAIAVLYSAHIGDPEWISKGCPMPTMDWQQVALNGGPPCFHVEGDRFCGRAERWQGHGNPKFHEFKGQRG